VPFRQVHIHGLVRDADRQKMSKTKGNTIDPLLVNEKYGTDAVRFALLVSAAPGGDIALSDERLLSTRGFANKIWNASRLLLMKPRDGASEQENLADLWIANSLNTCAEHVNKMLEDHRYHEAADEIWHFWWDDFCDWYLEFKKSDTDWSFVYVVFEAALRLLHPFMPFITEELWHRLGHVDSIALQEYPRWIEDWADAKSAQEMGLVQHVIVEIRQARADNKIDKSRKLTATVREEPEYVIPIYENRAAIERIANVTLTIEEGASAPVKLDIPIDRARIEKENDDLEKQIANLERQFSNQEFMAKAPEKVIAGMRAKKAGYEAQIAKNRAAL
jgi:valyl-tRNA synthetase